MRTIREAMTIYATDDGYRAAINVSDAPMDLINAPNVLGRMGSSGPFVEGSGVTVAEAMNAATLQLGIAMLHALRIQRIERAKAG